MEVGEAKCLPLYVSLPFPLGPAPILGEFYHEKPEPCLLLVYLEKFVSSDHATDKIFVSVVSRAAMRNISLDICWQTLATRDQVNVVIIIPILVHGEIESPFFAIDASQDPLDSPLIPPLVQYL